jgi:hypothetical protein
MNNVLCEYASHHRVYILVEIYERRMTYGVESFLSSSVLFFFWGTDPDKQCYELQMRP